MAVFIDDFVVATACYQHRCTGSWRGLHLQFPLQCWADAKPALGDGGSIPATFNAAIRADSPISGFATKHTSDPGLLHSLAICPHRRVNQNDGVNWSGPLRFERFWFWLRRRRQRSNILLRIFKDFRMPS